MNQGRRSTASTFGSSGTAAVGVALAVGSALGESDSVGVGVAEAVGAGGAVTVKSIRPRSDARRSRRPSTAR